MITPPLEAVWPDVERRLRALLYRRGLDHASAEDVVQEVAVRALAGGITFTSAKDLLRWAGPVACNLHVDLLRQRARLMDAEPDPERPALNDVAGEVADRLELQRALRGLAALRPSDRAAIMEAVHDDQVKPHTRKEAVRLAVRRHRARSRLALVMEQLAAWFFGWRWVRQPRTAAMTAALVPVALAVPMVLVGPSPAPGPREVPVPPAAEVVEPVTRGTPVRRVLTDAPERRRAATTSGGAAATGRAGAVKPKPKVKIVDVDAPGGIEVEAGGDDRHEEDGIVCVYDLLNLPPVCV